MSRPGALSPGKRRITRCTWSWVGLRPVLDGCKNFLMLVLASRPVLFTARQHGVQSFAAFVFLPNISMKQNPSWECNGSSSYLLTPWCRVLHEKLTGLQLVKKMVPHLAKRFPTYTEPKNPSPYSQGLVTEPYSETDESRPQTAILFL